MRHHARRVTWVDRVPWPFVAWCLFLALLVSWAALGGLLVYIATGA
jgi:hypothetical protein